MAAQHWSTLLQFVFRSRRQRKRRSLWGPDSACIQQTEQLEQRLHLSATGTNTAAEWPDLLPDAGPTSSAAAAPSDRLIFSGSGNSSAAPPAAPHSDPPHTGTASGQSLFSAVAGPSTTAGYGWGIGGRATVGGVTHGVWGAVTGGVWGGNWGTTGGSNGTTGHANTGEGRNNSATTVSMLQVDEEALEGPYTESKLDEARFRLVRTGGNIGSPLDVYLRCSGSAIANLDYYLADTMRLPLEQGRYGPEQNLMRVTFQPFEHTLDLLLITKMDHQFEADESARITIARHPQFPGSYTISTADTFTAKIIDATADLDITRAPDGSWLSESAEDLRGAYFPVNSDFDARRLISDMNYYGQSRSGFASREDDVLSLRVTSHLLKEHDAVPGIGYDQFSLDWTNLNIRVYRYNESPVPGEVLWTQIVPGHRFALDLEQSLEFRVEGTAPGLSQIFLNWGSSLHGDRQQIFDRVLSTCWETDLDIDSNNNDATGFPQRNDWEELLENHDYGIGKLIYQHPADNRGDVPGTEEFIPAVFSIQPASPDVRVRFRFPGADGESGIIRIWTESPTIPGGLIDKPFAEGGHRLTSDTLYTLDQLAAVQALWIEALDADSAHSTMAGTELGRPDDRLSMDVLLQQGETTELLATDEVRYLVTEHPDTLYPNLVFHHSNRYWASEQVNTAITLRDALISKAIYDLEDLPEYGLELLGQSEMLNLGLSANVVRAISALQQEDYGLKMALYLDYLQADEPGLVVAFAGTELGIPDILCDIVQGLGLSGTEWINGAKLERQYFDAMTITNLIIKTLGNQLSSIRATGHSLGGGLASAVSVASHPRTISANTFNAAGLHRNTITRRDEDGNLTEIPIVPPAFNRYEIEKIGAGVINAFALEYDALTFLQDNLGELPVIGKIPVALGRRITLDGPFDQELEFDADALRRNLESQPEPHRGEPFSVFLLRFNAWVTRTLGTLLAGGARMAAHHTIRYVQYALMVQQQQAPLPSRKRIFDIFGFRDPDGRKP